jgi:hypothetical protein
MPVGVAYILARQNTVGDDEFADDKIEVLLHGVAP